MEARADPTNASYIPRPEWYFMFLFEMLKFFPGRLEPIGVAVIPGILVTLLFLLPFLDRGPARSPLRRPVASLAATAVLVGVVFLTYKGATAPAPAGRAPVARAILSPELQKGREVFEAQGCGACHTVAGQGGASGPDLSSIGSLRDAAWLGRFVRDPEAVKAGSAMPDSKDLGGEDLSALVGYLSSLK